MWRIYRKIRVISGLHQEGFQLLLLLLLSKIIRWKGGDWVVVGAETLDRGDAPGWRFNDGILVFGGWNEKTVKKNVVHIGNDFSKQGQFMVMINLKNSQL